MHDECGKSDGKVRRIIGEHLQDDGEDNAYEDEARERLCKQSDDHTTSDVGHT